MTADPELDRLTAEACACLQRLIDIYNRPLPKPRRQLKRDEPLIYLVNGQWVVATKPARYHFDPSTITTPP